MHGKATDELLSGQSDVLFLAFLSVVFVFEFDLFFIYFQKSMVGDSNLVRIATKVIENLIVMTKRTLGISDPLFFKQTLEDRIFHYGELLLSDGFTHQLNKARSKDLTHHAPIEQIFTFGFAHVPTNRERSKYPRPLLANEWHSLRRHNWHSCSVFSSCKVYSRIVHSSECCSTSAHKSSQIRELHYMPFRLSFFLCILLLF